MGEVRYTLFGGGKTIILLEGSAPAPSDTSVKVKAFGLLVGSCNKAPEF
jgi:hypothetical protein